MFTVNEAPRSARTVRVARGRSNQRRPARMVFEFLFAFTSVSTCDADENASLVVGCNSLVVAECCK